jgi:HNH endonuclease
MNLRDYIEERSIPEPNTGCWIWMAGYGSHGYGGAVAPYHTAHRASFVAFHGPIPPGALVQHSCDNHWCCAPHHLSLGTDKTNAEDRLRKGRTPLRKLTARDARAIRDSIEQQRVLADQYGVDNRTIWMIRQGRIYREAIEPGEPAKLPSARRLRHLAKQKQVA